MKKFLHQTLVMITIFCATFFSCSKEEIAKTGNITLSFKHTVDGEPVVYNSMQYINTAGNQYEVKEVQWFISDLALIRNNESEFSVQHDDAALYVDTNIAATLEQILNDKIPTGDYSSIRFTFGIKGHKNLPGQFPNLPQSNMIWPYALGGEFGGYHYMKLNGFWINVENQRTPFNFHIGVGQLYNSENEVTAFIQNWFEVSVPISFSVLPAKTQKIEIIMDIGNWFRNPHVYDHNVFGSMIMKNQEAMNMIKENGEDVFSVKISADH